MPPAWPPEDRATLDAFYGKHELKADGMPTQSWINKSLTTIVLPYPMTPSWEPSAKVTRIQCHRLVADSLKRVLSGILAHYGSIDSIKSARMNLYGGAYNFRRIAGSAHLSLHAWGAAIDLDPEHNPLGVPWRTDAGMMPQEVIDIFTAENWKWGGRFHTRPDCMHFQATS
jgi:D-alanyl-D-alanine carboxypeptidase-like protein